MPDPMETIAGKATRASTITPAMLSDESLAAYLDVSARLIRQWRTTGALPPTVALPGRLTRWRREDIDTWITALATK